MVKHEGPVGNREEEEIRYSDFVPIFTDQLLIYKKLFILYICNYAFHN